MSEEYAPLNRGYGDRTELLPSSSTSATNQSNSINTISKVALVALFVACVFVLGIVAIVVLVLVIRHLRRPMDDDRKTTVNLNIYLRLNQTCERHAKSLNYFLRHYDEKGDQKIDFETVHLPHITLFATGFEKGSIDSITEAIKSVAASNFSRSQPCVVTMEQSVTLTGNYLMWGVRRDACLQTFSDMIVHATSAHVSTVAKKTIPDWVHTLPEDIKQKKIEMIHQYGSPNVFSQYQPQYVLIYTQICIHYYCLLLYECYLLLVEHTSNCAFVSPVRFCMTIHCIQCYIGMVHQCSGSEEKIG